MRHKKAMPFTLVEMIAVMGVMIVLAAVAIPAYNSLFAGRKTTLAANQLNGAVMEARAHAVSAKVYTALVFKEENILDGNGKTVKGYQSFRMAEVYHNPDPGNTSYTWRRWAPGSSFVLLPENTLVPSSTNNFGLTTEGTEGNKGENTGTPLPEVSNLTNSGLAGRTAPAIIFKPNGQLAGTGNKNMVVRFAELNRYKANPNRTPKLPLNINWVTCKTKFLDPVE